MSTHRLNFWASVIAVSFAFMLMADHCSRPTSLKAEDSLRLTNETPSAGSRLTEFEAGEGRLLRRLEQEKAVYQQKIEAEVNAGLRTARDRMGVDSEGAIRDLKILQQMLHKTIGLDNEVRTRLLRQIEAAMREANRRSVEESLRQMRAQQNRADAIERLRQVDEKYRDENKISQLMQRFNSLNQRKVKTSLKMPYLPSPMYWRWLRNRFLMHLKHLVLSIKLETMQQSLKLKFQQEQQVTKSL